MATRSALRVTRLGPAHAGQLAALIDKEPVTNVYLRSELRLGFESGDWWGAFEDGELTSVVLGWSLVVPYIPDLEAAPPLAQALYTSVEVGQEIPPHLYRAVAEILAYIFKLMNGRLPG